MNKYTIIVKANIDETRVKINVVISISLYLDIILLMTWSLLISIPSRGCFVDFLGILFLKIWFLNDFIEHCFYIIAY